MRHRIDTAFKLLKNQVDLQMSNDITSGESHIVRKMIKAIPLECLCDDYLGFECGCGNRRMIVAEALKELEKIEKEETK